MQRLRLQPMHTALRRVLDRDAVEQLQIASEDSMARLEAVPPAAPEPSPTGSVNGQGPVLAGTILNADRTPVPAAANGVAAQPTPPVLEGIYERANEFFWRATESLTPELQRQLGAGDGPVDLQESAAAYRHGLGLLLRAATALPEVARGFNAGWPVAVREIVPGAGVGVGLERTWAPLLAYLLFHALPGSADTAALFDTLDMRPALAESFAELGLAGEDSWRYAARVRLLLGGRTAVDELRTEGFWVNGDVRWLAGVHESDGTTYVNQESFEQLLCWLQLPALLGIAGRLSGDDAYTSPATHLSALEGALKAELQRMEEAGYNLHRYMQTDTEAEPEMVEGEAVVR